MELHQLMEGSEVITSTDRPVVAEQQGGDFWRVAVPVYHMAMPLTADGNGPASPDETVGYDHEVWDQLCRTLCRCSCAEDAVLIAKAVNLHAGLT